MTAFGLTLQEAWTITVPDFFALLAAHKRIHGRPEGKASGSRGFTPAEVRELRAVMDQAENDETQWRAA